MCPAGLPHLNSDGEVIECEGEQCPVDHFCTKVPSGHFSVCCPSEGQWYMLGVLVLPIQFPFEWSKILILKISSKQLSFNCSIPF